MRKWMATLVCTGLAAGIFMRTAPVSAAGANCDARLDAVEKLICSDGALSSLDVELGKVYAARISEPTMDTQALRRDQRNWLADRDNAAWLSLGVAMEAKNAPNRLAPMYRDRIAFLRGLINTGAASLDGKALAQWRDPATHAPPDAQDVLRVLGDPRMVVESASRTPFKTLDALLDHVPVKADAKTLEQLRKEQAGSEDRTTDHTLAWLPANSLGGAVYSDGGTADCSNWTMFSKQGDTLHIIDTPEVFAGLCMEASGFLGSINQVPAAIQQGNGISAQQWDTRWQLWQQGKWLAPEQITLRYDHNLAIETSSCKKGVNCRDAAALALSLAKLYDARPLPHTLPDISSLHGADREHYAQMVDLAKDGNDTEALPVFDDQNDSSVSNYGEESTYFVARLQGKLLLGRIGHRHVREFTLEGWDVGLWALEKQSLDPIAGIGIERKTTGMLTAARQKDAVGPGGN